MIIVTGTKRSGTSMWMQCLGQAGLRVIGEAFMGKWGESIRQANPRGFYESKLRQGVFYATNPNPKTGQYLRPEETTQHAVKVFIPGLARTDIAFINHVIATMRPWQVYTRSIQKLYAMEDAHHLTLDDAARKKAQAAVRRSRPRIPPEVEWWLEHYDLIRDVSTRGYPIHFTSYERMLNDPEKEFKTVFRWLGTGDAKAAASCVDPGLHRSNTSDEVPSSLPPETLALMDELYDRIHRQAGLNEALIGELNRHQAQIVEQYGAPSRERMREDLEPPAETAD